MERRKHTLVQWSRGEYLCASNDRQTVWRFSRYYEDGSVEGLKGYFWEASYLPVEQFDQWQWRDRIYPDPDVSDIDSAGWRIAASALPTRKAAIDYMLSNQAVCGGRTR